MTKHESISVNAIVRDLRSTSISGTGCDEYH
jgi:hypothetical protein